MDKPTLKDIAESVGVSVTTASLVLSGKGRISEQVRTAVIDAANQLGYTKHLTGSPPPIKEQRPAIGVCVSVEARWAFTWGFIRPIVAEIDRTFTSRGYDVRIIPIHDAGEDADVRRRVADGGYRAVFSIHFVDEPGFSDLEGRGVPVIVVMNANYQDRFHSILIDDFQSSYEGTRHLLELGHRKILFAGTDRINLPKLATDRFYGFSKALDEFGVPASREGYLNCEATNSRHLEASLREVFSRRERPTAIFAIDDDMAIRVIALLAHSGIRVPEDVSIIAPGDLLNYEDPFVPSVTTLRTDTVLLGRLACDMMLRRLAGEHEEIHAIKIKQRLIQRGSTKPIATATPRSVTTPEAESRARVLDAFRHNTAHAAGAPHGPPAWLGASREFIAKACVDLNMDEEQFRLRIRDDIRWVSTNPIGQGTAAVSPFGVPRRGVGYGQATEHPLRETPTIARLRSYPWPDPAAESTEGVRDRIAPIAGKFAIAGGSWSPFWHDAVEMVGMETMAWLMYDDPVFVETLLNRIVDYYVAVNTSIFEEAADLIDILFIHNDFGTQLGPIMSEDHFRRFITPCLRRIVDVAHRYDTWAMLASSGGIRPLIPALIETQVDALHALQPDCPGMQGEAIKREYAGRIVLSGGMDARGTLLHGDPNQVRRNTLASLDILAHGGGYLAAPSSDALTADVPTANVLAMYDAIDEWRRSAG